MMDIIEDLLRSLIRHGFKKILFINGHGGNAPGKSRLYELSNEFRNVRISWYDWWRSHSLQAVAQKHQLKPTHASWLEAFQFNKVDDLPSETKKPPFVSGLLSADQAKQAYEDGNFGGPYEVEHSIMDEIFEACLQDVLELLKFNSGER
jgi:creatinine amidohydrolase